uniref:Uncharacterized protein n=1 Tax=Spongospora subterranea TaxID=70186 RepID=A0A0H5R2M6_9EUKA|eukprot:CRZ08206.1 hypothetical protein [Spongospora subterranea]
MARALLLDKCDEPAGTTSSEGDLSMAARPEIGNKKAKKAKLTPISQSITPVCPEERSKIWDRLATSNELRSAVAKDRFMMQLFAADSEPSPQALEFRMIKQQQAIIEARIELSKKQQELRLLQSAAEEENEHDPEHDTEIADF